MCTLPLHFSMLGNKKNQMFISHYMIPTNMKGKVHSNKTHGHNMIRIRILKICDLYRYTFRGYVQVKSDSRDFLI